MRRLFQKQYFVILVLETWPIIADTDQNNIFDSKAILEQIHTYPQWSLLFC